MRIDRPSTAESRRSPRAPIRMHIRIHWRMHMRMPIRIRTRTRIPFRRLNIHSNALRAALQRLLSYAHTLYNSRCAYENVCYPSCHWPHPFSASLSLLLAVGLGLLVQLLGLFVRFAIHLLRVVIGYTYACLSIHVHLFISIYLS